MHDGGHLRIGELSRRTGVSPEVLRAWEQRYGLLRPERSAGGFRLYSTQDEERVRATSALIADGLSAAEAARRALDGAPVPVVEPDRSLVANLTAELRSALDAWDAERAHGILDRLFAALTVEASFRDVLLPYLHDLGDRWAAGEVSVAQEHFASNLIRGRVLGLGRDWGSAAGPHLLLACLPGEEHDLGTAMFGVLVARRGWRVTFLGADTPLDTVATCAELLRPALVVLSTTDPKRARANRDALRALAASVPLGLGGEVRPEDAAALGARTLPSDLVDAARTLTP